MVRWVTSALILLTLCACSRNEGEARLQNYLKRLDTVLELGLPSSVVPPKTTLQRYGFPQEPEFPKARSPSVQISLLDFLGLYGCRLQSVVGEQNTNLASFAEASQDVIRAIRFIELAPECVGMLREAGKQELAITLERALQQKTLQLERDFWLATLGSKEAREFWKAAPVLGAYPEETSVSPIQTLGRLLQLSGALKEGNYHPVLDELEPLMSDFRTGDGGELYRSLQTLNTYLEHASTALRERAGSGGLCFGGRETFNRDALANVVQTFFAGDVQEWAAGLSRRYYALILPYQRLEEVFSELEPKAYKSWRVDRDARMAFWLRAPARHVAALKPFLDGCPPA